ncbi:LptF/LptG family permease [Wenyingzhuangia aestuarii]|uniref:LptF/LptG family permease n=1 Tax=Wenyingzhuangia aestuarii TaxID=1647582 RepID=UPI00143AEF8C|nr:LptF/LptG family permease [Wenyingzhuangia aestuarii]NJB83011.1 lipopolysaccharide export system permease protein [Wenyingzhuangia aestuarii]
MRILDKYILLRYLKSVFFTLFILIPIAVVIDVSEKVDKFLRHDDLTLIEILRDYYLNFIIYYGNTFLPLATFIACIMFTSKLASNTEIIAISSANISFTRFLRPYFIGATILASVALAMNHFVVPKGNEIRHKFEKRYIDKNTGGRGNVKNFNLQLNDSAKVYIKSFNISGNRGFNFSYSEFEGTKIKYKLVSNNIVWDTAKAVFQLPDYTERFVYSDRDSLSSGKDKEIVLDFTPEDLKVSGSKSMNLTSDDLSVFIKKSEKRGVKNLNSYYVELYQRTSLPVSAYILTLIAVSLASRKKRGGVGINLAIGVGLMFIYVFFMKVAKVLGSAPDSDALFMAWLPNIIFGIIATYLYIREKNQG